VFAVFLKPLKASYLYPFSVFFSNINIFSTFYCEMFKKRQSVAAAPDNPSVVIYFICCVRVKTSIGKHLKKSVL